GRVPDRGPRVGGADDRGARPPARAPPDRGGHPAPAVRPWHRAGADPQGDRRQVQPVARADPPAPGAGAGEDAPGAGSSRPDVRAFSSWEGLAPARQFGYVPSMSLRSLPLLLVCLGLAAAACGETDRTLKVT